MPCDPCVEFDSVIFAREMLLKTDLLTFLPVEARRPDIEAKRIVVLAIPAVEWLRRIGILFRKRNSLSPSALALIREMQPITGAEG